MTFGQNLQAVRTGWGWSRQDLAAFTSMSLEEIEGIELGVFEPSINGLYRLAAVCQCSTDLLMYGPPTLHMSEQEKRNQQIACC